MGGGLEFMGIKQYLLVAMVCVLLVGCNEKLSEEPDYLTIYSPHPLEFIDPIIGEFENETGIEVEVVTAGTGELLARIESEKDQPIGDVLWGGSISSLESKKELFASYYSVNEPEAIYKNVDGFITRFTTVPSVIMVNTNLIGDIKVLGYEDLLNPRLKGRIAYADPSKSSSSYEQLLNQLQAMGGDNVEKGWRYVGQLIQNLDGQLLESSSMVYTGVVQGKYTIGLTFEEAAAIYVEQGAPVEIIYPIEGTIVRPDGVCLINGSDQLDYGKQFIDFVTSYEIQVLISTELNRRSNRLDVEPTNGLKPYEDIRIIEDDQEWSSKHRDAILIRYESIFNNNLPQD
jgi:iron(III) transport system substrate-binding protein